MNGGYASYSQRAHSVVGIQREGYDALGMVFRMEFQGGLGGLPPNSDRLDREGFPKLRPGEGIGVSSWMPVG